MLSDEERGRMARFRFEEDRHRYLATRVLVRTTLSRYVDTVPPESWHFTANAYGRPAIADCHDDARGLSFNVSHTRGLIALAVTRDAAVGVDVERVVTRVSPLDVAGEVFSDTETAELAALDPARRQRRFFEYWTLRESYAKARGTGLSMPMDQLAFSYESGGGIALSADAGVDPEPQRWSFWQLLPEPDCVLALCVEKRRGETPRLLAQAA
jgi:4'-phosphopantetheinyl transferase